MNKTLCGGCGLERPLRADPYGGAPVCEFCYVPAPQPAYELAVCCEVTGVHFTLTVSRDGRELLGVTKLVREGEWVPVTRREGWWRIWAGAIGAYADRTDICRRDVFFRPPATVETGMPWSGVQGPVTVQSFDAWFPPGTMQEDLRAFREARAEEGMFGIDWRTVTEGQFAGWWHLAWISP